MSPMRIPLGLAGISVAGLVIALVATGPATAIGVALVTVPLLVVVRTFVRDSRRRNAASSERR